MNARRADTISFWVSVVTASVMAALLGFRLSSTDLDVATFVFAVVSSWTGLYMVLNHVYAVARRVRGGA